jgi:hypothetical protein
MSNTAFNQKCSICGERFDLFPHSCGGSPNMPLTQVPPPEYSIQLDRIIWLLERLLDRTDDIRLQRRAK